jgi:molecular chaperone DnaK
MEPLVVGIDLGTTFSAVAYLDEQGTPQVVRNAEGATTTPSAVLIEDGNISVGEVALNQWITREQNVVRWIKRAMGDPSYSFQGMTAVQISAEILKALKRDAETQLGQPIAEAVITCPAYFASVEIENTRDAGRLAGLNVREIVKEPTAAAVHYGVDHMKDGERVLVCDLGGGTYDATLLAYEGGAFVPKASMGDRQLGGHDWTMELVELVAERMQEQLGEDPRNDLIAGQMLYEACERAKRDFARTAQVAIPCSYQGKVEQVTVTRDEFESRSEWRMQNVVMWSEQAVQKAGLAWKDVDKILLVGGSSRLRRLTLALEQASGKKPVQSAEPDLAVAKGAAILARGKVRARRPAGGLVDAPRGGLVEVVFKRMIARSLGTRIVVFENDQARLTNALLIPHSTESPVSRTRDDFAVLADDQKEFNVPVVEFESDSVYDVVHNFRFQCAPQAKKGDRIKVTFHYDESGVVSVDASDLKSGRALPMEKLPYQEPDLEAVMRVRVKPRWVVFALDCSGSMDSDGKIEKAKSAVLDNAKTLLSFGEGFKVGLVTFSDEVNAACRPTSELRELERALSGVQANGTTWMDEGIRLAVELVQQAPTGVDRDVVMVTDGMPDDNRRQATLRQAAEAKTLGVTLSSVGIGDSGVDKKFLDQLSPIALVIDKVDKVKGAITDLLTQAAASRGGLVDSARGGLVE